MRRVAIRFVVSALVVGLMAPAAAAAFNVFDRAEFIRQVRTTFQPLEARLAPGDQFDYDHAAFFSGFLNGRDEHLVVLLLTEASPSVAKARELGVRWSWEGASPLPLFAVMVLSPTDCIRDVEYNVPYLVRGTSWETGDVIDASGGFVRDVETSWARGTDEPLYLRFSGNLKIHIQTCVTVSMNQN